MANFCGHWYQTSIEGLDGYCRALNLTPSTRGKWVRLLSQTGESGHVEAYHVDMNLKVIRRRTFVKNMLIREFVVPFDVECYGSSYDGSMMKFKMSTDGTNKLTRTEHGIGNTYTVTATAEVNGNTMTSTWHCGNATCVCKFKKLGA